MSRESRLALSLLVQPGDPRLRDLLLVHEPDRIVAAIRGGPRVPDVLMPDAWTERARISTISSTEH
ncbi:hypothetical protein [Aeromicrobium sp. UC242_57]|uniref:hypothetical protein n=1 Tax=Aeromicrobium sp. UC242_57 TaxID=3374624 RepID=UPI0037913DC6